MLKRKLIEVLADGRFHSGSEAGELLGVSRAAVWKQVKRLEEFGLVIHAVPGKGYQIPGGLDLLDRDKIINGLEPQLLATLQALNVVDATDSVMDSVAEQLRHQGQSGFYVCLAESKILSRAKYGRASYSTYAASADLAIGARLREEDVCLDGLLPAAAMVVQEATECSACQVKWPGELMALGKSLGFVRTEVRSAQSGCADILIEVDLRIKSLSYLSIGAAPSVISLEGLLRMPVDRNQLIANLLNVLAGLVVSCQTGGAQSYLQRWQACDLLSNRPIELSFQGRHIEGYARGLDSQGRLKVETKQGVELFSSGDVILKA